MSKVNAEPADEASGRYRELIRQNAAFSRAVYVALQAGTETAAGMTATVRTRREGNRVLNSDSMRSL
jgi:hypothetical protein